MLTKIQKDLKHVTWFGWLTFGVAVVALWFSFTHKPHHPPHKAPPPPAALAPAK